MSTAIKDYIVSSKNLSWQPLIENGKEYPGVFVKSLRYDADNKRSPTILLKFEPGGSYPYHNHPKGEEILVMDGDCTIEGAKLNAGDYLYTPPNFKHSVQSENGCTLLLVIPEEVEIL